MALGLGVGESNLGSKTGQGRGGWSGIPRGRIYLFKILDEVGDEGVGCSSFSLIRLH